MTSRAVQSKLPVQLQFLQIDAQPANLKASMSLLKSGNSQIVRAGGGRMMLHTIAHIEYSSTCSFQNQTTFRCFVTCLACSSWQHGMLATQTIDAICSIMLTSSRTRGTRVYIAPGH